MFRPSVGNRIVSAASAASGAKADLQLQKAAASLREQRPLVAESILRRFLEANPANVDALAMLAEAALRLEQNQEAEDLLVRCLDLAPDFAAARRSYVTVLLQRNKTGEAFLQIDELLGRAPDDPASRSLKAMAHGWVGAFAQAAAEYDILRQASPKATGPWLAYAHTLKTLGRRDTAIAAYRDAIAQFPRLGEAWWSLANLKGFRFSDAEVAAMREMLATATLTVDGRIQIQFALGKALEDAGRYAQSFEKYEEANVLKRATLEYNAEKTSAYISNCKTLFTPNFLADRAGTGCPAPDPIFIVGLPRSGSTLIEQILSSHSAIEGTTELYVLPYLAGRIGSRIASRHGQAHRILATDSQAPYPEILRNLDADGARALGEEFLERTRPYRTSRRPFFIDRMPDNFGHVGLIQMILPNAKIIDVRRHPLACCFSNFKQYFPLGKDFSYSLTDLGRYYADYIELMAHFDRVLPGKIHRVFYERIIENPQREIRRLLDYLGLNFEEQCLRFYETERPVRSASSEQVRMPIFRDGLEAWRPYEPWLGPLKTALGPALTAYAPQSAQ